MPTASCRLHAAAADAGNGETFWPLLREAFAVGRPDAWECATHALNFALSKAFRDRVASRGNRVLGS